MTIKLFAFLAFGPLLLIAAARAQSSRCSSAAVDERVRCANIVVDQGDVTSNRLSGRIDSPDAPILIEIYKLSKSERKLDSWRIADSKAPHVVIETNDKGEFCHPGLAEGFYLVRFGTIYGVWNCTYVKVHILKGAADRKIKVSLSIGT